VRDAGRWGIGTERHAHGGIDGRYFTDNRMGNLVPRRPVRIADDRRDAPLQGVHSRVRMSPGERERHRVERIHQRADVLEFEQS
jgi:hypothetical protein